MKQFEKKKVPQNPPNPKTQKTNLGGGKKKGGKKKNGCLNERAKNGGGQKQKEKAKLAN